MVSGIGQRAEQIVHQRLPDLARGPSNTTGSALRHRFVGRLQQWVRFEEDVWNACTMYDWGAHREIMSHRPSGIPGRSHLSHEHVWCGDEHGVQGRFEQHIGQVMSAIFGSYELNLVFGDFRASTSTYTKVPDIACMDLSGELRFIGEMKTPWVLDHLLQAAIEDEMDLRSAFEHLGQIAMYLRAKGNIHQVRVCLHL